MQKIKLGIALLIFSFILRLNVFLKEELQQFTNHKSTAQKYGMWIVLYYFGSKALASALFQPIFISLPNLISRFAELFGTFSINSLFPRRFSLTLV